MIDRHYKEDKAYFETVVGKEWRLRFVRRHKNDLKLRTLQNLKRSKTNITFKAFSYLKAMLVENQISVSATENFISTKQI